MSKRNALHFLMTLTEDRELYGRAKAADSEGIVGLAEELGLSVTFEELETVYREIRGIRGEIEDEQLDLIVGGISTEEITTWTEENLNKLEGLYEDLF